MTTLLEKAKQYKGRRISLYIGKEDMELAIAWSKDEIGIAQIARAYETKNSGNVYSKLAVALKMAIKEGLI